MNETRDAPAAVAGPGRRLYEARMRAQLSAEQVAEMLHLSTYQIAALERDEFERLPGPTYIRGYLRNYAQLLGLPSDEIVQSYARFNGATRATRRNTLVAEPEVTTRDTTVKLATFLVAGILILLAVVWWHGRSSKPLTNEPTPPQARQETPTVSEPEPVVAAKPAATMDPKAEVSAEAMSPPVLVDEQPTGHTIEAATAEPQALEVTEVAPPDPVLPESVPAQAETVQLVLHTRAESWVDIRDARDNKLLYMLVPAERRITLSGVPPFEVFVGNPEGVTVEFDGQYVHAVKFKRGLVARFTLDLPAAPPGN